MGLATTSPARSLWPEIAGIVLKTDELTVAIYEFLKVWDKRSKYHYTDRILIAAIRKLRSTIEDTWLKSATQK